MTHLITDASIDFIQRHKDRPLFLYVAHETPHFPFQGPEDKDKVVTKENWMERDPATYVAMLEDMDSEVGRLLAAIDDAGIREKTVVIFVSDNGGLKGAANMAPLRGAKGTTLEGAFASPSSFAGPAASKRRPERTGVCDLRSDSIVPQVGRRRRADRTAGRLRHHRSRGGGPRRFRPHPVLARPARREDLGGRGATAISSTSA